MLGVVYDVGRSGIKQLVHHLHDLVDSLHGADIVLRRENGEQFHIGAEKVNLRGAKLTPIHAVSFGTLEERIIDVGDVLDVVNLLPGIQERTVDEVKGQVRSGMAQVGGVIGRDATHVHGGGIPCDLYGSDGLVRRIVQAQLCRITRHRAEGRCWPRMHSHHTNAVSLRAAAGLPMPGGA